MARSRASFRFTCFCVGAWAEKDRRKSAGQTIVIRLGSVALKGAGEYLVHFLDRHPWLTSLIRQVADTPEIITTSRIQDAH